MFRKVIAVYPEIQNRDNLSTNANIIVYKLAKGLYELDPKHFHV
jgi:hypothetical protein